MKAKIITVILTLLLCTPLSAQTDYSFAECLGSSRPYVDPTGHEPVPDGLRAVMINHVGRHGSRYISSGKYTAYLQRHLQGAASQKTITSQGRQLLALTEKIIDECIGRWGALDTLGKAEQRWLAARMTGQFPKLFKQVKINAVSSYVPRAVASMYEFCHQLARQNNNLEILASSGPQNTPLLRFWQDNADYSAYVSSPQVTDAWREYALATLPPRLPARFLGAAYADPEFDPVEFTMSLYSVLAGTPAMEFPCKISQYVSRAEFNSMWAVKNLRQYLDHSASALGDEPAQNARALLADIIATTDSFIGGKKVAPIQLRFAHAETLLPLLALIKLPAATYISPDLESVADNWRNFDIVPMAANFRLILFTDDNGGWYIRADLNEKTVPLAEGYPLYLPWEDARMLLSLRLL